MFCLVPAPLHGHVKSVRQHTALGQVLAQSRIYTRLPAIARGLERVEHVIVEAHRGGHLGRILCRPAARAARRLELVAFTLGQRWVVRIGQGGGCNGSVLLVRRPDRGQHFPAARFRAACSIVLLSGFRRFLLFSSWFHIPCTPCSSLCAG